MNKMFRLDHCSSLLPLCFLVVIRDFPTMAEEKLSQAVKNIKALAKIDPVDLAGLVNKEFDPALIDGLAKLNVGGTVKKRKQVKKRRSKNTRANAKEKIEDAQLEVLDFYIDWKNSASDEYLQEIDGERVSIGATGEFSFPVLSCSFSFISC